MKTIIKTLIISTFSAILIPSLSSANTLDFKSVPADTAAIHNEAFPSAVINQYEAAYTNHKALMDVVNSDYDRCMSTGSNTKECGYFKALGTENVNAILDRKISSITRNFTE
jgi:hypothetical protein